MRQHLDDLRTIQRVLLAGKLDEARKLAFFFSRPMGVASRHAAENRDIVLAAASLASASTVEEALRHEVRIATACAACHAREGTTPVFRAPSNAPTWRPTAAAQMARHQWAVDRLWEAVTGPSDEHWYVALDAIANTVIPVGERPEPKSLGIELQRKAKAAASKTPPLSQEQRAAAFGDLLVTCTSCHAQR